MLQNIHDKAQGIFAWIIVGLIAIPFTLWGIHEYFQPSSKRTVAEVNGTEISEQQFNYGVQQQRQQLRAMFKQDIDLSFMDKEIKERTLKRLIEEEVLVQTAIDTGFRIGDTLLAQRINELPAFQQNGSFSQANYQNFLSTQGLSHSEFEAQIRRALLTDQLREGILRSTLLTTHDRQTRARLENQQRAVSYLMIPTTRFKDTLQVSEADIESYYKNHQTDYLTTEKVSIEYVELVGKNLVADKSIDEETLKTAYEERRSAFTTPASWHARHLLVAVDQNAPADKVEAANQKAQDLLAKIKAGQSFEDIATKSSDDKASATQGGDLGTFGPGTMVKPFEEALKKMKVGEVSQTPVKSNFGFHLIKLVEATPEKTLSFEEVKDQLRQDLQKEQAESVFYGQQEQFANLAFEQPNSLEPLVKQLNLKTQTTELFDRQTVGKEGSILANHKVIEAAFSDAVLKEKLNSEVIEIAEQHLLVLRLKEHQESVPKPVVEVKTEIVTTITQGRAKEQAKSLGQTLLDELKQKNEAAAIAKAHNLTWTAAQWIGRKDTSLKLPTLVKAAFEMGNPSSTTKAIYQGLELPNGDYALVAVLAVKDGEEKKENATTVAQKTGVPPTPDPQAQAQMLQQRGVGESEFQQLVQQLKTGATIKIYSENTL